MKTSTARVSEFLSHRQAFPWLTDIACLFEYCFGYDNITMKLCSDESSFFGASRFFIETADRLRGKHGVLQTIALNSIYYALGGRENAWTFFAEDWSAWVCARGPVMEAEVKVRPVSLGLMEFARALSVRPQILIGVPSIWRAEGMIRGMLDALTEGGVLDGSEFLNRLTMDIRSKMNLSWSQTSDPFVLVSVQAGFDETCALQLFAPLFEELIKQYPALM